MIIFVFLVCSSKQSRNNSKVIFFIDFEPESGFVLSASEVVEVPMHKADTRQKKDQVHAEDHILKNLFSLFSTK
jgi:hypothetical protein